MSGFQFASTVARELDVTLPEVGAILEIPNIKPRTPIAPDKKSQLVTTLEARKAGGSPPAPTGTTSQALEPTRRTRWSKGAFEPARLNRPRKLELTLADQQTLRVLERVVTVVKDLQGKSREAESVGHGRVAVRDLLKPERRIPMELAEFRRRNSEGTLPPLHPDTLRELAEPLSRLSLVNVTCRICREDLERPYYRGMLENILAGGADLPLRPNHRRAIKYPSAHKGCPGMLTMMSEVEAELIDIPEGDAKETARWEGYMVKLQADGGQLLTKFKKSEHRELSGSRAMARVRAIQDHVKQASEE
jgi:hypothetical protein